MDAHAVLGKAQWEVDKALATVADGLLEVWASSRNFGLNIEALKLELLLTKATLELASSRQIGGQAMAELLQMMWDSVPNAGNLLDQLNYFRLHDQLHGTYDTPDHRAKGGGRDLALGARHTAKAVGKLTCLPSGCMPKLGELLSCSSSPHAHDDDSGQSTLFGSPHIEHTEEAPILKFDRVDFSQRMKHIVEQLQRVRIEVTKILQACDRRTVIDIGQIRPITTDQGYSSPHAASNYCSPYHLLLRDWRWHLHLQTNSSSFLDAGPHRSRLLHASSGPPRMVDVALSAAHLVVAKALAPIAKGVLESWVASKNLCLNIEVLRLELLLVQATLETASRKEIGGQAVEELLEMLRDLAHNAGNLFHELDYFRIQGTSNAADHHVHNLPLDARRTAKSIGKLACLPACWYATSPGEPGETEHARQQLGLDRVDVSERVKQIVEQLQPLRTELNKILQYCGPMAVEDIAQGHPITTDQSIEPRLYGYDLVNSIIHDVTKVLASHANGLLEAWNANNNFGLNIGALRMELLLVQATLETASRKQIGGPAMEELLGMMHDSAHNAGNLLDELDYFRIQDGLHGTSVAAGHHAKGGVHDLALNAHHTAKAVGKLACLTACWSAASPGEPGEVQDARQQLRFSRVDVSERMMHIIQKLQPVRIGVTKILQSCDSKIVEDIAQSHHITKDQSKEPRLYGMNDLVSNIIHDVTKVLAPLASGLLEAWNATNNFGVNIEALRMELLLVQATLETASRKQIGGLAMEVLLGKLRDSTHSAGNLLDELEYCRIQDELHGTSVAVDHHAKGGVHDLALNARHTAKVVDKLACLHACWSATSPGELGEVQDARQQLRFSRVDVSERMMQIVEQLQPVRIEVAKILQSCDFTSPDIAQSRPITIDQSIEPRLYGRDDIVNSIIHDMTKGQYCDKHLTVLPVVGPGGIGKTTLIQHIYHNQQVQNHFQVMVWICVSLRFYLKKLLQEIKESIPKVEGEKEDSTTEELIGQRLKSKRFLLVLDDIWEFNDGNDWGKLLLALKTSREHGSMVVVTTRFQAIAKMVGTTNHSIILEGLETEEFRKLFFTFVFDDAQCGRDHSFLLETGDKIMDKLKGSPLAAKTVGKLLRNDLNLHHWKRVLESKQWERQTGISDIMSTLKLSYDYLPFDQQQCFFYSALFPEDFHFSSSQLINFWIGLDILRSAGRNQTLEDVGLRNINDLVMHGFFKEKETNGRPCFVMNGLLHNLALKVASHECLTLHVSNAGSVDIHPSIRHLSIIIDDDNAVSVENFKTELKKLKTRLKVEHLQTLMLFGEMDESVANIFGDLFMEANALRVLHLLEMSYPMESMLPNFSTLVHLRYLFLGTKDKGQMHRFLCPRTEYESQMHLPPVISRFYDLRILDLGSWYGHCDFPKDLSNLTKLHHFVTQKDELHSAICNVGKLELLKELKVFRVNKESEGFEPKQLENLTDLSELGIYNLENIHTKEEAASAKLIEKYYLESLTLDWDSERSNTEPDVEAVVLETLQPHRYLQELCIGGHRGLSCPTWLGDKLAVEALQFVHLSRVSWEYLPPFGKMWGLDKLVLEHIATLKEFVIEQSFCRLHRVELVGLESFEECVPSQDADHMFPFLQVLIIRDCPKLTRLPFSDRTVCPSDQDWNIDWFPKLQELEIEKCPELLPLLPIPWTGTLCSVNIKGVMLLEKLVYSNSSHGVRLDIVGKDDLHSLDQVLAFNNLTELEELTLVKCPPLELKHLVMLTSLKTLIAESSDSLVGPLGGQGDLEWHLPVEHIEVQEICGNSAKELTKLLTHLPRLSRLEITECGKITHLAVGVDLQQTTSAASEVEKDEIPPAAAEQEKEDGLLLFLAHLSNTLRELVISHCPELVLVAPPTLLPDGGGWLQALRCLQRLKLKETPKFLSSYLFSSPSCRLFPSSLQVLELNGVEGMGTVEPLSNLTSLTLLELRNCGEDLRCKGLGPLLTTGGQLSALIVYGSPRFFAGWDPNPRLVLQDGGEQQLQLVSTPSSCTLQKLWTDDVAGLLTMPICSLLSSSLTQLQLSGTKEMERFSNEQENALHLLTSLLELEFLGFDKLQHLPAGLHKLTCLMEFHVGRCPSVRSLPKDGLPKLLLKLDVWDCGNEELIHQCRGLTGSFPKIRLEF